MIASRRRLPSWTKPLATLLAAAGISALAAETTHVIDGDPFSRSLGEFGSIGILIWSAALWLGSAHRGSSSRGTWAWRALAGVAVGVGLALWNHLALDHGLTGALAFWVPAGALAHPVVGASPSSSQPASPSSPG